MEGGGEERETEEPRRESWGVGGFKFRFDCHFPAGSERELRFWSLWQRQPIMKGYDLRQGGREEETEDGQRGQVSCLPLGAEMSAE